MPKYMLLMNTMRAGVVDEGFATMSPDEIGAHINFMIETNKELKASGEWLDAQGLSWPDQAKIVIADEDGEPEVSDGPFPESKEFLAGFWVVEVEDETRALAVAGHISTAPGKGGVSMRLPIEVREIMSAPVIEG